MMWHWGFGGFWFILPIAIILWGMLIWGIVALIRRGKRGYWYRYHHESESALDILKKRYARGEITKEEFEDKKKAIS